MTAKTYYIIKKEKTKTRQQFNSQKLENQLEPIQCLVHAPPEQANQSVLHKRKKRERPESEVDAGKHKQTTARAVHTTNMV